MIIAFLFSLWDCYMGPIWDPSGQTAYGLTHMGPMPNPFALPIWVAKYGTHKGMFAGCPLIRLFSAKESKQSITNI